MTADLRTVTVVAGGVGAARFLRALLTVVPPTQVTAVVNTGDDTVLHGLTISPDLDTVIYTLAGEIDPERGWGLRGETWAAMAALDRFAVVRPDGSDAGGTWFGLGDRDLATHLYRTARRAEGASPTTVAAEIATAFGVGIRVLPMSDSPCPTFVRLAASGEEIAFQDYFVRHRHDVAVSAVRCGDPDTPATAAALGALRDAEVVVVAPSNPLVSIGPIRARPGVDDVLGARRDTVIAVSPIIGGAALKGPADRMLRELGHPATVAGVAGIYAPIASTLVIDPVDAELADEVVAAGMRPLVVPSVMSDPAAGHALAAAVLDAVAPVNEAGRAREARDGGSADRPSP
ncbi:MAG: 2-phospho-L-lactate transferase [Desertimonas sp.]